MISASLAREAAKSAAREIAARQTRATLCELENCIMAAIGQGLKTTSCVIQASHLEREVVKTVIKVMKQSGYKAYRAKERIVVLW